MLDMGQLTTFLAAAELGNFTHTGRRLHLSQSAVSQQMRDLEHQLGCPLFVRRSRNITLTPAGERLLPLARKLVADARDAAEVVREVGRDQQGVVRVAASPLVAHALLVPALAAFTIAHPGLRVCVDVVPAEQVVDAFRDDAYDVAVSEGRGIARWQPERTVIRRERVVAAWPAAWPGPPEGGAAEALAGVPLIAWPEDSAIGQVVREGLHAAGVDLAAVHTQLVVGDALAQAAAAANGLGVAFVPRLSTARERLAGRLVEWRLPGFEVELELWALASPKDPAAQAFLAWLKGLDDGAAALGGGLQATGRPRRRSARSA